jgi:O-antigen ligase
VGLGWPLLGAAGALSAYALLVLLSGAWSHAPGRALLEFDLPLVYLLVMVLFGSLARSEARLAWIMRLLVVAIFGVCVCGLISRVLPDVWRTSSSIANNRLSFPVSYTNALGLLATFGILLCAHLASDVREHPVSRVLATAALPVLASTLYFTFSRGAIAVAIVTLPVYLVIARPRALISVLLAAAPAVAVALHFAYDADLLASPDPTSAAATLQGHHVARAIVLCVLAAALLRGCLLILDRRLARAVLAPRVRSVAVPAAWIAVVAASVITAAALSGTVSREYRLFVRGAGTNAADLRARLTDPSGNRIYYWRVAWREFERKPALGAGAGTFANTWAQRRPVDEDVLDAHSLYLETLAELGMIGLVPLLVAIGFCLVAALVRARGEERPLYAAAFAVMLAWALHAGVDWDWEMPVLSVVFVALAGCVLARPAAATARAAGGAPMPYTRTLLGVGCLLLSVAPVYVWLSQRKLDAANFAFARADCAAASSAAKSSISILSIRAEPYEILSYCDAREHRLGPALGAIDRAVSLDPHNWSYWYDLAVIRATGGLDPRSAARRAVALNPLEPLTEDAWQTFASGTSAQWKREGLAMVDQFNSL